MTLVDVADLNRFGQDIEFDYAEGHSFNAGKFVQVFLHATVPGSPNGQIRRLADALNALSTRWNSALTLCAKIDWLHDQRGEGQKLPHLVWMEFMANDISSFFGDVREMCIRDRNR